MEKSNYNNMNTKVIEPENYDKIRLDICKIFDDNKSEDIVLMNLKSYFHYDLWFILATALSSTHLKKLANDVIVTLKKSGIYPAGVPNDMDYASGWIALDYGELIVHIFTAEKRDFYNLEELWKNSTITKYTQN